MDRALTPFKLSAKHLQQRGLEIKCRVQVTWTNQELLGKLKVFIHINYDIEACLKDDSTKILESLKIDMNENVTDSESEDMTEH